MICNSFLLVFLSLSRISEDAPRKQRSSLINIDLVCHITDTVDVRSETDSMSAPAQLDVLKVNVKSEALAGESHQARVCWHNRHSSPSCVHSRFTKWCFSIFPTNKESIPCSLPAITWLPNVSSVLLVEHHKSDSHLRTCTNLSPK